MPSQRTQRVLSQTLVVYDITRMRRLVIPGRSINEINCLTVRAIYQFEYSAEHIPGLLNSAADELSRNNVTAFHSLVPQAVQTQVPASLLDLLVTQRPDWGSSRWTSLFMNTLQSH